MVSELANRKLQVIDYLLELEDETLLSQVEYLLKPSPDFWNELSENQRAKIEKAILEVEAGQGIPHESVMQEFRQKYQR